MKSQFEFMFDAVTTSVPYKVRKGMFEKYPKETVMFAITLTRLANAQYDDDIIRHGTGNSAFFSRVHDYKVPAGFGYSKVIHYSGKIASRALAMKRGVWCVTSKRPMFPETFELIKSEDQKKVKDKENKPVNYENITFKDLEALSFSPREFDLYIAKLGTFEKNWAIDTNEITKDAHLIDTLSGFYASYDVDTDEAGELITLDPSASGVSLVLTEFFLITQTQDFCAEATSTIPLSEREFLMELRAEVSKHNKPQEVDEVHSSNA